MNKPVNARRSVWETPDTAQPQPALESTPPPQPVVTQLRVAAARPEAKRNRQWEQNHKAVTYRMVPTALRAQVRRVAAGVGCNVDQLAQALLEYGLTCYRRQELVFWPQPSPQGLTLYPARRAAGKRKLRWQENRWNPRPPEHKPRPRRKGQDGERPLYEQRVTYRLGKALRAEIAGLAKEKQVPAGEVVRRLLEHALAAYQRGELVLAVEDAAE